MGKFRAKATLWSIEPRGSGSESSGYYETGKSVALEEVVENLISRKLVKHVVSETTISFEVAEKGGYNP